MNENGIVFALIQLAPRLIGDVVLGKNTAIVEGEGLGMVVGLVARGDKGVAWLWAR